ncbi:MAG TPA: DUF5916 domain-containing protein [Longimicrobium sp.]|nr:DUF5916 domain-containing protein [Longimicrobium sp.]
MSQRSILLALALSALAGPAAAQAHAAGDTTAPVAVAVRAASAIRLDGRLDDAAWAAATPVTSFTQVDPQEGQPVSEATEARILFDDEAIYVGVRFGDRSPVSTRLGRRDMDLSDSDWVGVVLDSYHDHQTAYSFDINPSGVRRDALKTDNGDDMSWDAVWAGAAAIDSAGWSAEYRIPFSQLRFNPASEQTWGVQIERIIGRRNEYAVFSFTPKQQRGGIARFGHLTGLRDIRTGRRLEVLPYTVLRADYTDPGLNPFREEGDLGPSVGADVKYRITSDLTLDATINPDFGQVEQDPADVNLTAFETQFAEKRPFFVEGAEIFSFAGGYLPTGGELFYTRRIGGRASGLAPETELADVPSDSRILTAAKLSGKTRGGWSIGVMEALTRREQARFRLDDGTSDEMVVEPLTNYFVGRLRRDSDGGQRRIGGIFTAVNRDLESEALEATLHSAGYTAGVDFRQEFAARRWALTGYAVGSHVRGSKEAITLTQVRSHRYFNRLDADHLELDADATSLTGFSAQVAVRKQAGNWRGGVSAGTISPGFEINDLGYQRRGDRADVNANLTYVENKPGPVFRYWEASAEEILEHSYGGYMVQQNVGFGAFAQTHNYWAFNVNLGRNSEATDDRTTRGGVLMRRPAHNRMGLYVASDRRKPIVGEFNTYYQEDEGTGWSANAGLGLQLKASPRWNLSMGPSFSRFVTPTQYLGASPDPTATATEGYRFFFADLDQTTVTLNTRFNYTFNPDLTFELFLQPFVTAIDFGRTHTLTASRSFVFDPSDEAAPTDFTVRSLRGNALLRWEWRPGSTVYFAWQQTREGVSEGADFNLSDERAELFRNKPDNVFVLKINYWLNP